MWFWPEKNSHGEGRRPAPSVQPAEYRLVNFHLHDKERGLDRLVLNVSWSQIHDMTGVWRLNISSDSPKQIYRKICNWSMAIGQAEMGKTWNGPTWNGPTWNGANLKFQNETNLQRDRPEMGAFWGLAELVSGGVFEWVPLSLFRDLNIELCCDLNSSLRSWKKQMEMNCSEPRDVSWD